MSEAIDIDYLSGWKGRSESRTDVIASATLDCLSALLDHDPTRWKAGTAPPLSHWLSFLPAVRQSEIDSDGHPKRGGFLPPAPLPRRMWAGGRLIFHDILPVDSPVTRTSTIADIRHKRGGSGDLLFVTVQHELTIGARAIVTEEQDLVYREANRASPSRPTAPVIAPGAPPQPADVVRTVMPDPVMLFRFSALTFNSHRIHYDRDYARDEEGYSGLVVHGPLIATLLMDHFRSAAPGANVESFSFRALAPLLDTAPFDLCLAWREGGASLWARDMLGQTTFTADLTSR